MPKKIVWKWEQLDVATQRVQVIGGWLILRIAATDIEKGKSGKIVFRESMAFVADKDHEWKPVPPPELEGEKKPPEKSLAAAFMPSKAKT